MDREILETRAQNSVWNVAGIAIVAFFALLFIFNLFV